MTELKDWLNSINYTKNLIDDDPSLEKEYPAYIINKCLSYHTDTILLANEMNKYNSIPNKLQYDFFINTVRKRRRYSSWIHQDKIKDLDCIKRYYGYSNEKAKEALNILTKKQINFIKSKFDTGGIK